MPAATLDLERLSALMGEAAEAAASSLPLDRPLLAGFAGDGTQPEEFLPGDGAVAVACGLRGGLSGRLVFLATAELGRAALDGPLGANGLAAALEPCLSRATAALDPASPKALRLDRPTEVDPAAELAGAGEAFAFLAAPLFDGEEHRASLVLLLDDPRDVADDDAAPGAPLAPVHEFPSVAAGPALGGNGHPLRLLHEVEMEVTVELGRTRMTVRQLLGLVPGSVVELDRAAGAPVDLLVNGTLIGRGEVVVIDEEFGVRISEIIGPDSDDD